MMHRNDDMYGWVDRWGHGMDMAGRAGDSALWLLAAGCRQLVPHEHQ
jgi:hypothetical protein